MTRPQASMIVSTALLLGSGATAEVVHETEDPFGGLFGVIGFDVSNEQSVAVRFTPSANFELDRIRVWLWNNDTSGGEPKITITLRPDVAWGSPGGSAVPSRPTDEVLDVWTIAVPHTGFADPQLFDVHSEGHPLRAGVCYWICAESDAPGGGVPVWAIAQPGQGFGTTGDPATGEWWPGAEGMVGAVIVEGTRTSPDANAPPVQAGDRPDERERSFDGSLDEPGPPHFGPTFLRKGEGQASSANRHHPMGGRSYPPVLFIEAADVNTDGVVDLIDVLDVLAAWGPCE